jgi:stage II sporulation protein P
MITKVYKGGMKMKNKVLIKFIAALFVLLLVFPAYSAELEERQDGYYTIVSEQGDIIFQTAFPVSIGDIFIDEDNIRWKVIEVKGDIAVAKQEGRVDISKFGLDESLIGSIPAQAEEGNNRVGVYHTHDDESYRPTDGKDSIPKNGGIFKVGEAFTAGLKEKGFTVDHSKVSHFPHDGGAYDRSRRTAKELLQKNPIALFDIHRDAVPADLYKREIRGEEVTAVTLVVGRQNPNMKANEKFAWKLKEVLDKEHPSLIKGIFYAKGKYNQDMGPRVLLLEFGSNSNSRIAAEKSAKLFVDAVPKVLYGASTVNQREASPFKAADKGGSIVALGWIIGLAVIGGGLFLLISSGNWELAKKRISSLKNREFANFIGFNKGKVKNSIRDDVEEEVRNREKEVNWHSQYKGRNKDNDDRDKD